MEIGVRGRPNGGRRRTMPYVGPMQLRRNRLPAAIREDLGLPRGERPLAFAATRDGSYVVATAMALYMPAPGSGFARIPWDRVDRAGWAAGRLMVHEAAAGPEHSVGLAGPGSIPEVVRERVTATIVVNHQAVLPGGGKVRITGRRSPATGELHWGLLFETGLDPADPGLRAQAEQLLEELRRQTGL